MTPNTLSYSVHERSSDAPTPRWRRFSRQPIHRLIAGAVLAVAILAAVAPGLLVSGSPIEGDLQQRLVPPSLAHPFGTDEVGRDLLVRIVHGAQHTLGAVAIAIAIGLGVGALLGLFAGYLGGWMDRVVLRLTDILLAVPSLLLALAMVTALGSGIRNVAIAVGVSGIAGFARVTRAEVQRVSASDYVQASRGNGAGRLHILLRHVLPNSYGPPLALATVELGTAILAVSSLSFLGFGAPVPTPEWGRLVADGRDFQATAWWLIVAPVVVIVVVVLAIHDLARRADARPAEANEEHI